MKRSLLFVLIGLLVVSEVLCKEIESLKANRMKACK
jgi:hypothetical protein